MIKNNKGKLILSSAIILLPALTGWVFWSKLPERMAVHWGSDGNADGWCSKLFTVLGIPLILLALHWLCVLITAKDPKNKGQSQKVLNMILWIVPVISVFSGGVIYATAVGKEFNIEAIVLLLIGLMFVIIGNYLPKCKQNHTIGIKVKWALENEKNWNATHRFGGRLWVIGGLLMIVGGLLSPSTIPWVLLIIFPVLAIVPIVYSYVYYRKQMK